MLRPEYPDLIAGRPWAPPLFQPEEGPSPEDIASNVDDFLNLNRRIIRAQEDIADLEERLRRIREREAADRERDGGNDGSRPGGRGGAPGMGGGVSGGSSGGGEDDGPSGSEDSRSGIERRIDRLRDPLFITKVGQTHQNPINLILMLFEQSRAFFGVLPRFHRA